MADITEALYTRLSGDATLQGLLSTYEGGAAVFTTDPIPENAELPYVTVLPIAEVPFDSKQTFAGGATGNMLLGREISYDVGCYDEDDGSIVDVEAIRERVRALLHRHVLTISNFTTVIAEVSGALPADEDGVFGRIVTIRLIVEEV